MGANFFLSLVDKLRGIINPLKKGIENPEAFAAFMAEFGWDIDTGAISVELIARAINITDVLDEAVGIVQEIYSEGFKNVSINRYLTLVEKMKDIIQTIRNLTGTDTPAGLPDVLWDQLTAELFYYLISVYLRDYWSPLYAFFVLFGVIEEVLVPAEQAPGGNEYTRYTINWNRLVEVFTGPGDLFKSVYNWNGGEDGTGILKYNLLLKNLGTVFSNFRLPVEIQEADEDLVSRYYSDSSVYKTGLKQLCVSLVKSECEAGFSFELNLLVLPIPPAGDRGAPPDGILITPSLINTIGEIPQFTFLPFTVEFSGVFGGSGLINIEIYPGNFNAAFDPGAGDLTGSVLNLGYVPISPMILFGSPFSHRFQLNSFSGGVSLKGTPAHPEVIIQCNLGDPRFIIDVSDSDGFLKKIFGEEPQVIDFFDTMTWSSVHGFSLGGQFSLDFTIPIHKSLSIVNLELLHFKLSVLNGRIGIILAITANATLGPVAASVEEIGIKLDFIPVPDGDPPGVFGSLDFQLGFKPPTGVGLSINAGGISGGGFLWIDNENKRYAGILNLNFGEIGLVAVGLITTRMPDGSDGFSLLISIGVTFSPPIQLAFGFTLSGVGGLIGLNRTMKIDVLREGLKNHTADSILFPEDPILNALKIISDMRSVFPPAEGRYVVGPMVKIGWGSPNIITVDIGVFIEFPSPIRIVLLGEISAALPEAEDAVIEIHIDVLGVIDFDKKTLAIDASIYDSRILALTLTGDAALRWRWGNTPFFALSLGGFHPKYTPPPDIPLRNRLTLNISMGSVFQAYCKCYLALTSNSLQFGAELGLLVKFGGFSIDGKFSFDALFYFSPFSFSIDLKGNIAVKYSGLKLFGVHLSLSLSGPRPWNARGTAGFEILFWEIKVKFNITWGPDDQPAIPAVNPWVPLKKALELPGCLSCSLPAHVLMVESMKELAAGEIVLHPAGNPELRQIVLPFSTYLEKLGNSPVKDYYQFDVEKISVGSGAEAVELEPVPIMEHFSRGQYESLNKQEKLSLPDFEKRPAGVKAMSRNVLAGNDIRQNDLSYEMILINEDETSDEPRIGKLEWFKAKYFIKAGAARKGNMRTGKRFHNLGESPLVEVREEGYMLVNSDTLIPLELGDHYPLNDGTMTRMTAERILKNFIRENPESDSRVQVVSQYEVVV